MRERLEGMSPEARRAATVAAVLGRSFRFDDLVTMLGTAPAPLLEAVEELVRADILAEDADGLRFRHDLICEAVLDTVPAPARRALDRQAAEVLLRAGALPVEIAARLADSAEAGDAVAAQVLHQAARTLAASDLAAACDFSVKALELIADDAPERVPLVKETALLLHLCGRVDAARAFAADALVHALTPGGARGGGARDRDDVHAAAAPAGRGGRVRAGARRRPARAARAARGDPRPQPRRRGRGARGAGGRAARGGARRRGGRARCGPRAWR